MKNSKSTKRLRSTAGFTLIEVLLSVSIIVGIVGASIAGFVKADENAKANTVVAVVAQVRTAVQQYTADHGGFLPVTESTTLSDIPTTGAANATAALVSAAVSLEGVLFADRSTDKPLVVNVGPNLAPSGTGAALPWNNATQTFTNSVATTWTFNNSNRIECFVGSASATPLTASPVGSSFLLDGVNTLTSGKKVVTLIIPNCPASIAYKISKKMDGDNTTLTTSASASDDKGQVIYATPVAGVTTVYIYVVDV